MSQQANEHHGAPDLTPGDADAPLRPKKPWRAPVVITGTANHLTEKVFYHDDAYGTAGPAS